MMHGNTTSPAQLASTTGPAPVVHAPVDGSDAKTLATLRARAALAGFTLSVMTDTNGRCLYLVSRWGMSRTLTELVSLVAFLRQVGAVE